MEDRRKVLIRVSGLLAVVCGVPILLTGSVFAFYGVAVLLFGEFHGRTTGVFYLVFAIAIVLVGYVLLYSGWRSLRAATVAAQQSAPADPRSARR